MTASRTIAWPRLGAEAVAIIGSILIAFWIDAWWEERQERIEERETLNALRSELEYNISQIDISLEFQSLLLEPTTALLEEAANQTELSSSKIEELIGQIFWVHSTELAAGVHQSLVQGGQLSLVNSRLLRSRIASLMTVYEDMQGVESFHAEVFSDQFVPFLLSKTNLTRITNSNPVKPTETERRYPVMPETDQKTSTDLLEDDAFIGILTQQFWNHYDAIYSLNKTRAALQNLIEELDEYLAEE